MIKYLLSAALLAAIIPVHAGVFTGRIVGTIVDPVYVGSYLDLNGNPVNVDNTTTAPPFVQGVGTNRLQWGDFTGGTLDPGVSPFSAVVFNGSEFTNQPGDTTFNLGTISYTNGTSYVTTGLYFATLRLVAVGINGNPLPDVTVSNNQFQVTTTQNDPSFSTERNADFLFFNSLMVSFHVAEGATATAFVRGAIVGDPVLTMQGLANPSAGSFLGTGPGSALQAVPEPGTYALVSAGLAAMFWFRRRR